MLSHVWSLICKEVKIDKESNNISIIDAFEEVQFEATTPEKVEKGTAVGINFPFQLVTVLYRDNPGKDLEVPIEVRVLDPEGKQIGKFENTTKFLQEQSRVRNIIRSDIIAITVSGTYLFQVHIKDKNSLEQVAAIPLSVTVKVNGENF